MRKDGHKFVWFSDESAVASPNGNLVKRVAKRDNHLWGTKSKFSGPFTEEELKRFNSKYSTGKW